MTFMRKYMGRLRLLLLASLATIIPGCATWEDHQDSGGAKKANSEAAIFKAHLDNTHRIVNASDGSVGYQYDPAQSRLLGFASHPRVRLAPGQYIITVKTWPFGSLYDFEVNLEAGHIYKVDTYLCSMECLSAGKPYRYDMWIQDFTTRERISEIVSECFLGKKRQRERRKVQCPEEEVSRDPGRAAKANSDVAKDEEGFRDAGHAVPASPELVKDEEVSRDAGRAPKANAEAARDEEGSSDVVCAVQANREVAVFKTDPDKIRRIVSAPDGSIEYQYDAEQKPTKQSSDSDLLIELPPGQHIITVKTWPFGSLYEFQVDLRGGHTYEFQSDLCAFECISVGEPYRQDRWIQDLTTRERISEIVSECFLGKKRNRKERRKVPCPAD